MLWELLVLTLLLSFGFAETGGTIRNLGNLQLVAADVEVSLSLSCSTSSGIRWDFMNLQS